MLAMLATLLLSVGVAAQQGKLTDEQASAAIRLGQQGRDLSVRVGTITTRGGYCDVIIDGPAARVAAAAASAFRQYRPFTADDVTLPMKALTYCQV
jgi:hypothetical protein